MPKNGHYHYLKDRWTEKHKGLQKQLWDKHKNSLEWLGQNSKQLALGSLGSLILVTAPMKPLISHSAPLVASQEAQKVDKSVFLISDLLSTLPPDVRPLTGDEEKNIGDLLSKDFKLKVSAELNGKRLNRSYGLIGAEQHLARFPGDNMETHFQAQEDASLYYSSGMAPGLGAWGYFAPSRDQMTQKDSDREKYYIAVQTFLSPEFNQRIAEYRDFYKFRKMLVVNPQNGKAVVAVVGDAGPAEWTGKHLGGSPEIMKYLDRVDGAQRGPVLYYFIDDPNDNVPLGPILPVE